MGPAPFSTTVAARIRTPFRRSTAGFSADMAHSGYPGRSAGTTSGGVVVRRTAAHTAARLIGGTLVWPLQPVSSGDARTRRRAGGDEMTAAQTGAWKQYV